MAVNEKVELLRQMYVVIGEAVQALQSHEKNLKRIGTLERDLKSQKEKVQELAIICSGLEKLTKKQVIVCPECFGAGGYLVNGAPEECDKCDGAGWIEKTEK